MAGFDIRLRRDMDLDADHYRFYGRNGIYVSAANPVCSTWPGTNIIAGHPPLVVNITGTQLATSDLGSILIINRVSEFAPPGIQNILSYASGWLAALGMVDLEDNMALMVESETDTFRHCRLASFHCHYFLWSRIHHSPLRFFNNELRDCKLVFRCRSLVLRRSNDFL